MKAFVLPAKLEKLLFTKAKNREEEERSGREAKKRKENTPRTHGELRKINGVRTRKWERKGKGERAVRTERGLGILPLLVAWGLFARTTSNVWATGFGGRGRKGAEGEPCQDGRQG